MTPCPSRLFVLGTVEPLRPPIFITRQGQSNQIQPKKTGGVSFGVQPWATPFPLDSPPRLSYVSLVANASKNMGQAQTPPAKTPGMPFEEALKKLESIVEAMESEDLPLETLLAKYEEGTRLAKICQEKLSEAEVKIQQLEKTAAGEVKLKPLALTQNSGE
jgi:exodeoxyribonuclease VII small subunit